VPALQAILSTSTSGRSTIEYLYREEAGIASLAIEYPVLAITLAALTLTIASRIIVICLGEKVMPRSASLSQSGRGAYIVLP